MAPHELAVRHAFDTMNTPFTSVNDGSTEAFVLESEYAKIPFEVSSADKAVLGDISNIYYQWEDNFEENIMKHIEDDIWELRPGDNRVFDFFYDEDGKFVLLHQFKKKTQKTPKREILPAQ